MTALRFVTVSTLALMIAACGEQAEPDHSPYAGGETQTEETVTDAADANSEADPDTEEEVELRPNDLLARQICDSLDGDYASLLPAGTAFAARGGDGNVYLAWNFEGAVESHIVHTPSVELDDRMPFDLAVGDFQRHNMTKDDPNRALTGADRKRDGGFCALQTEAVAIEPLIAAYRTVEPLINAE